MAEKNNNVTTNASNAPVNIATIEVANKMIKSYVTKLQGSAAAQQFLARVQLMLRNNTALANCDPQTIFIAAMACAHLELPPNTPEGYAYIIPYGKVAQFQLGYKGLVELAFRSGVVKSVNAELVFTEDEFSLELGTERKLVHKPSLNVKDRSEYSKAIAVYATAKLNNGEYVFEAMNKADIEKIRSTSKAGNNGPWKDWADQMAKKTVLKRLLKLLPSSNEDNRFKEAAQWDSVTEGGKRLDVDKETGQIIEGEVIAPLDSRVIEAIDTAQTIDDLQEILDSLSPADKAKAQPLIDKKIEEL